MLNTKLESIDTVTQSSSDLTLTISTHAPSSTTTLTIADGSSVTGTEVSTAILALQTQIDALVVDVAALIAAT